ncbi:MAG: Rne/Rng family ribonuclease [Bdellovibrionales bacterium]|nr:Rne/Rng family ribonuclease [Bdellovibrionales bacterium]
MARRMLINALYPEECRVAVAEEDKLLELEIERSDQGQLKGNIYKAPITRIEPSLQAAFLDIGSNRNGFLQINDINPSYFGESEQEGNGRHRPAIQDVLRARQHLVVQVVKDERAAKGATLTTNLSIPGRYLVLMIGNQRGGVSRKIVDEGQRRRLRQAVQGLKVPAGMGVIVRTAGINKSTIELQRDLDALLELWYEVVRRSLEPGGPKLLYQESNLAIRTIRDYLTSEIDEILIDEKQAYETAREFVRRIIPAYEARVKFFDRPQPLFSTFHLDAQVDEINQPEVILPSGGSIVINTTEAIVAIDVNSGRSTGQSDVEETAFATNKEAAEVIARQLRLRDLGGLIVIDFIDMTDRKHKQVVERVLKDSVRSDKAKIEVGRISKFGLLEMSRQRLKSSLVSQNNVDCPHCAGRGRVRTPESAALEVLRKIQSSAYAGGVSDIRVHMSPAAALLLLNQKRHMLTEFEQRTGTHILIYADGRKKPDEYELELVTGRHDEGFEAVRSPSSSVATSSEQRRPSRRGDSSRGDSGRDRGQQERERDGRGRDRKRRSGSRRGRGRGRGRGRRGENASASGAPNESGNSERSGNNEKSGGGPSDSGGAGAPRTPPALVD